MNWGLDDIFMVVLGKKKKKKRDFNAISVMSVFYRMTRKGVFYLSAEGLLTVIYMR